jgi:hypothetical protein
MSSRIRRAIKPVKQAIRRAAGIEREQVYVVSFPKSGRTWLQVMLGEYITRYYGLDVKNVIALKDYTKHLEEIPRIRFTHDGRPQWKTADELDTDKSRYQHQRVIMLVRDPRDILVSSFFEKTRRKPARRSNRPLFKGTIHDFVYNETGGIDSIIAFYNIWACSRDIPRDMKCVKYEKLRREPRETLSGILSFIGLPEINEQILDAVLELGNIDKMRKMEADAARGSHTLRRTDPQVDSAFLTRAFQPADPTDPETFKVRKGKVGGYVDYLDAKEIEYLDNKIEADLDPIFGY